MYIGKIDCVLLRLRGCIFLLLVVVTRTYIRTLLPMAIFQDALNSHGAELVIEIDAARVVQEVHELLESYAGF